MTENKKIIYCPQCGDTLVKVVDFCSGCGGKIPEALKEEMKALESEEISEFSEESLKQIAKEIVVKRMVLRGHWIVYIFVNVLLYFINFFTTPTEPWYLWPMVSWGLALLIHTFNFLEFKHGLFSTDAKKFLGYHLFITVLLCGYLVWIDWFTTGVLDWWYWPVIPLLIAAIFHLWIYNTQKPKKDENPNESYLNRKVQRELKKIKKET